jgi:hypothetical protein
VVRAALREVDSIAEMTPTPFTHREYMARRAEILSWDPNAPSKRYPTAISAASEEIVALTPVTRRAGLVSLGLDPRKVWRVEPSRWASDVISDEKGVTLWRGGKPRGYVSADRRAVVQSVRAIR